MAGCSCLGLPWSANLDGHCFPADQRTVFGIDTLASADEAIAFKNTLGRDVVDPGLRRDQGDARVVPRPLQQLPYGPRGASAAWREGATP